MTNQNPASLEPDNTETEAKFIIQDAETFAALKEIEQLDEFAIQPLEVKKVVDRYLDGPHQEIFQAGFACRLRTTGQKKIVTLKSLTPSKEHLHHRQELEIEVDSDRPQEWPDSEVKEKVFRRLGQASLQPLFTIYQTRHQYHLLREEEPLIELSLDEVAHNDQDEVDYFELEAELLAAGDEDDLQQFVEALQNRWSLSPQNQSKFERAWAAKAEGATAALELTAQERATLEKIAGLADDRLAKRATIILAGEDEANSLVHIAKQVDLTPRTVKKWRKKFRAKRLDIFPADVLGEAVALPAVASRVTEFAPVSEEKPDAAQKSQSQKKRKKDPVTYQQAKIGLEPTDTLAEAGRKVLGYHFARMLEHESGTRSGEDIEDLHDMRVATRRMRAAFKLFGQSFTKKVGQPLQAGLKETGRALGPVRDLDVMIEKLQTHCQTLSEEQQAGLQPLLDMWQTKRAETRDRMLAYLDSKKYRRFKQNFLEFVTTPGLGAKSIPDKIPPTPHQLRHIVPGLIYTYYEEVRAYETILDTASIEVLHQLRISFKGLRYTLEYLQDVLGDERKMLITEVKAMQDHLGELNDADVAANMLHDFFEEWEAGQQRLPLSKRQSSTQLVDYLNANLDRRHQLLTTFPEVWANFNRPEVRQNLAKAISLL